MRLMLDTVSHGRRRRDRRGREGRGADALQRRADRRRLAARRWTSRSTRSRARALTALGLPDALAVIAHVRARHDVRPGPVRLHGEDGRRARTSPTCSTSTARSRETLKLIAKRKKVRHPRPDGHDARPRAPRGGHQGDPRGRARASASSRDGDVSAALLAVTEGTRRSTCSGASAARPRACSRRRRSSASAARSLGRLWPRNDEERKAALDAGYDLDEVLDRDRLVSATTSSSPPPASPTATCSRASATRAPAAPPPNRS